MCNGPCKALVYNQEAAAAVCSAGGRHCCKRLYWFQDSKLQHVIHQAQICTTPTLAD